MRRPDFDPTRPLFDTVRWRAEHQADLTAFSFLSGRSRRRVQRTYADLDRRARVIGRALAARCAPGDRALLLFAQGLDFVEALLGCVYAGVVAVPAFPPDPTRLSRTLPRLLAVLRDADAHVVLTISGLARMAEAGGLGAHTGDLAWITVDTLEEAEGWQPTPARLDELALLQYTSGSTSRARGVEVRHRDLLACMTAAITSQGHMRARDRMVSWLPVYHDFGLIGATFIPLFAGIPQVGMSPLDFLKRPLSWLQVLSQEAGTISGAPNFALDLCTRRLTALDESARAALDLDLGSLRTLWLGGEPVRAGSVERFEAAFGPYGLRPGVLKNAYGLAEATLVVAVSGPCRGVSFDRAALQAGRAVPAAAEQSEVTTLVGAGWAPTGMALAVVDPENGRSVPEGVVGEVWAMGRAVADGYWGREDPAFGNALPEHPGPWLRTGDLGFLHHGELFVVGRLKDLIIVAGANHLPEDLEEVVQAAHPAVRPGGVAVFGIETPEGEGIAAVVEVRARIDVEPESLERAIRAALSLEQGLGLAALVFIRPRTLPKTSSGKLQRARTRLEYLAGTLSLWTP